MKRLLACLCFLGVACAPSPSPTPTPTPSPTVVPTPTPWTPPSPIEGVRVVGDSWVYKNKTIELLGAINCDTAAEWSIYPPSVVQEMADHGANYTHIRLGPFWTPIEPAALRYMYTGRRPLLLFVTILREAQLGNVNVRVYDSAYAIDDIKKLADLNRWNPIFWDRVDRLLNYTSKRTPVFITEIDVFDGWIAERPELSPLHTPNNIQGEGWIHDTMMLSPPGERIVQYVYEVVRRTGWAPVVYQIGNETGDMNGFGTSTDWEWTMRDLIWFACDMYGYPRRPVGTNSQDLDIEFGCSYASRHTIHAQERRPYPVWVNEFNDEQLSPEGWRYEALKAREMGTTMHLWRCNWTDAEYQHALDYLLEMSR